MNLTSISPLAAVSAPGPTRLATVLVACLVLMSCAATPPAVQRSRDLAATGRSEEGLAVLQEALKANPTSPELRSAYLHFRDSRINGLLAQAFALSRTEPPRAKSLFNQVLAIDQKNSQAQAGLAALQRDAEMAQLMAEAELALQSKDDSRAITILRRLLAQDPSHVAARQLLRSAEARQPQALSEQAVADALRKPVTIELKEATLKQVFDIVAKTSGLNFVFDRDVRTDQRVSLSLREKSSKEAVDAILLTSQLEQRKVDANTILIYPNTPAKLKDYQTLTMRTFFLANAEVEAVGNSIKTLVKTRDLIIDKKQNMIIMRDTPEAVRIAENLVALHDLAEPEVMLEVEILEINRNRLTELGVKFPDQLSLSPLPSTSGGSLTLGDLRNLQYNTIGATMTPLTLNARGLDTDIKLLANPRIRARNRETAKVLIGDKVPNITSTSTSTGFVAENVQYLDVGLKLDITPTISIDNEVAIKISLEVSNIANQIKTSAGTLAYQIGARTASTVLRLRDGENQVLAGLINDEDRKTSNKVPGLGNVPFVGRLFSSDLNESRSNEIVLSITPRLIRNLARPEPHLLEFDSGTESSARSGSVGSMGPVGSTSAAQSVGTSAPVPSVPPSSSGSGGSPSPALPPPAASLPPGSSPNGGAAPPGVRWQGPLQVKAGQTFNVQLMITPPQPIYGVTYAVGFDPAVIEIVNVAEGLFLKQGGAEAVFSPRIDRGTGQIFINTQRSAGNVNAGAVAAGELLTLTLKAVSSNNPTELRMLSLTAQGREGATVGMPIPAALAITVTP